MARPRWARTESTQSGVRGRRQCAWKRRRAPGEPAGKSASAAPTSSPRRRTVPLRLPFAANCPQSTVYRRDAAPPAALWRVAPPFKLRQNAERSRRARRARPKPSNSTRCAPSPSPGWHTRSCRRGRPPRPRALTRESRPRGHSQRWTRARDDCLRGTFSARTLGTRSRLGPRPLPPSRDSRLATLVCLPWAVPFAGWTSTPGRCGRRTAWASWNPRLAARPSPSAFSSLIGGCSGCECEYKELGLQQGARGAAAPPVPHGFLADSSPNQSTAATCPHRP